MANRFYEYRGEVATSGYFAKKYGLYPKLLWDRLRKGMTIDEAIETPVRKYDKNKMIEYFGVTKSCAQWAQETGIACDVIKSRLWRKWSAGQALGFEAPPNTGQVSLCWRCSKTAAECCWLRSLEPIEGWQAQKVLLQNEESTTQTYNVEKCPQFELWEKVRREELKR